ncbi:MAG TPA: beta-ketoacyl synthase N-terminal-like domain-containing protein [Phycisphaerae bacterium]|nr:beta-ketoacyl synthase N-terminal-like domain-containing protein [Phycisphaerae bacterium]
MPAPRIGLESPAGFVDGLGPLDDIFLRWRAAAPPPPPPASPLSWQKLLWPVAAQSLDPAVDALILATTKGDIARQVAWMRAADAATPAPDAPPTLGSSLAELLDACNLHDTPAWVVSTACSSGLVALIDAAIAVQQGQLSRVLVAAADVHDAFTRDGFHALKALSPSGACRPFDRHRDGLILGAAAAACIVAPLNQNSLCEITGFGISNDASHMTAPDRQARGLLRAIHAALRLPALTPTDIDALLLHGTGTRYNDAMEAAAINALFPPPLPPPPVTAVKGLIGHTLGASGLIEALLATHMIAHNTLPPIVGLQDPEYPALPTASNLSTPLHRPIRHLLKTASGFGGMNAALLLSRIDSSIHSRIDA